MTIALVGGVGGSNLGQTQVELSDLNHDVCHELGPPVQGVTEYC